MSTDIYAEIARHREDSYTLGSGYAGSIYAKRLFAARDKAQRAFALARGWRVSDAPFSLEQLRDGRARWRWGHDEHHWYDNSACKHICHFRIGQKPVAIVANVYSELSTCQAFAEKYGLQVEQLPESWYWPRNCLAVCYTKKP